VLLLSANDATQAHRCFQGKRNELAQNLEAFREIGHYIRDAHIAQLLPPLTTMGDADGRTFMGFGESRIPELL